MNMISQLRARVQEAGLTTLTADEYNQLQREWITRTGAEDMVAAERERICAAIKAADDEASTGDYMLDSDDCISVIRGTWNPQWAPNNTDPRP